MEALIRLVISFGVQAHESKNLPEKKMKKFNGKTWPVQRGFFKWKQGGKIFPKKTFFLQKFSINIMSQLTQVGLNLPVPL
jgi:hypothetical protein